MLTKVENKVPFCYNRKTENMIAGDGMNSKISVLDIEIDKDTAKEAMKKAMAYMESELVNIIEMVTIDGLMLMKDTPGLKEDVCGFDLVLAGDKTILEAAEVKDGRYLQETEKQMFLKTFLRYLHKNHKRVYLLVESEKEGQDFYHYMERYYGGVQIIGMAKVSAENRADDMLVNAINGGENDCVLSMLSAPLQEEFIVKNRSILNTRIWLGLGKSTLPVEKNGFAQGRLGQFLLKRIFKKEIEKSKKSLENQIV